MFYAVLVPSAFVIMRFALLADVVEYAGSFSNTEPAHASNDAGWKDRKMAVAAGEKK